MNFSLIFALLSISLSLSQSVDREDNNSTFSSETLTSTFVPSDEWQEIPEGAHIPPGLHIRINLETGKKEAKFISEGESHKDQHLSTLPGESSHDVPNDSDPSGGDNLNNAKDSFHESVIKALKKIKSDENPRQENEAESKKFRSYSEIKAEFKAINVEIETDVEILRRLIQEFKNAGEEIRMSIIEDLSYLVHQIDNAVNFIDMGGIEKIVKPALNSSNSDIRKATLKLIGSASQSNPKVQIAFLEEGVLSLLIRIIAREKDLEISSKSVFALSCITRGFPYGQQRLVESGGLETLREIFQSHDWKALPLQLKIVSLIQDLINEHQTAIGEKAQQLSEVKLSESLLHGNWCSAISSLLAVSSFDRRGKRQDMGAALAKGFPLRPDHDMVDKVINAMTAIVDICQDDFASSLSLLSSLENSYVDLAYKEQYQGDGGYELFRDLSSQISILVKKIRKKDEL